MSAQGSEPARRFHVSMRWKMLAAFAGVFTLVYLFIGVWVFRYTTDNARERLRSELYDSAQGGAKSLDAAAFDALVTTVPAVRDPKGSFGYGYPTSPLYKHVAEQLLAVRNVVADAGVYSYYRDPQDGKLYFVVSAGYLLKPQTGVTYKVPAAEAVGASTYALMEQGLQDTTFEPEYTDAYGTWESGYSPIRDGAGKVVGAIGIDYPMTYVSEVQRDVQRQLWPVLGASYVALLVLVLLMSTWLTRPLKRLTAATQRIADGDYDVDLSGVARTRFPDEMASLTESFVTMRDKVRAREQSLTQEVRRLKVEIDQTRREQAVREITETDFFSDLTAKAAEMRRRRSEQETPTS